MKVLFQLVEQEIIQATKQKKLLVYNGSFVTQRMHLKY